MYHSAVSWDTKTVNLDCIRVETCTRLYNYTRQLAFEARSVQQPEVFAGGSILLAIELTRLTGYYRYTSQLKL